MLTGRYDSFCAHWHIKNLVQKEIRAAVLPRPNSVSVTLLHRFLLFPRFLSSLRYNDVDLSPGWGSPLDRGQRLGVSK